MRQTFVNTLAELARKDDKIVCVIGDTGFSVFEGFEQEFGERFVNVGIAEQNFVGFGAGLAAMGMRPFIYNVASFMVYRAYEQIELDVAYQENPVVLVGVGGGHAYGTAGPTHHAYFDVALMRELPNMVVLSPADPVEMREAMYAAYKLRKPTYIRIGRSVDPIIHHSPVAFTIGKAIKMRDGEGHVVIFATGVMVKDALKASEILENEEISVAIYSVHTLKPIDEELVKNCMDKYDYIVTVEEHSKRGGLGSAVGETMLDNPDCGSAKLIKLGFPDIFAPVTGSRGYLNDVYGISANKIATQIRALFQSR